MILILVVLVVVDSKDKNNNNCPSDCVGDFIEVAREWSMILEPGSGIVLGKNKQMRMR